MIFNFDVFRGGSIDTIQAEMNDIEAARVNAYRLLGPIAADQARVVVSDADGVQLFTLTCVGADEVEAGDAPYGADAAGSAATSKAAPSSMHVSKHPRRSRWPFA